MDNDHGRLHSWSNAPELDSKTMTTITDTLNTCLDCGSTQHSTCVKDAKLRFREDVRAGFMVQIACHTKDANDGLHLEQIQHLLGEVSWEGTPDNTSSGQGPLAE